MARYYSLPEHSPASFVSTARHRGTAARCLDGGKGLGLLLRVRLQPLRSRRLYFDVDSRLGAAGL